MSATQNGADRKDADGAAMFTGRKGVVGMKPKDLIGIPWMLAFALRADGWYLRCDIVWAKPNPMPESVRDRPTKSHEYVFMLSKSARYFYDQDAIAEPAIYSGLTGQDESGFKNPANFSGKHAKESQRGEKADKQRGHGRRHAGFNDRWDAMEKSEQCGGTRNKRSVWSIATQPFSEAHFATMAPELAETCIKAGCPKGGTVLDPFGGAGTTALCADRLGRNALLIELNPAYVEIARKRLTNDAGLFAEVAA
jgi:DNA modification methylase